jgi:KRAB domain-containing zinc finger protein
VDFIIVSLILGCGHGDCDKEASMHSVCVEEVSDLMTPKAGPSTQKTHTCDICVSFLKDILHLATPLVQKLYMSRVCTSLPQKHHTAENLLKWDMDRTSFEKSCEFFVSGKWFNCNDLWKDFSAYFEAQLFF